jgi:hypothetical protein
MRLQNGALRKNIPRRLTAMSAESLRTDEQSVADWDACDEHCRARGVGLREGGEECFGL